MLYGDPFNYTIAMECLGIYEFGRFETLTMSYISGYWMKIRSSLRNELV